MAPEVLIGKYTKQADLWSVGVIAYMLMSSQMPFYGRTRGDIVAQIMEGYVMTFKVHFLMSHHVDLLLYHLAFTNYQLVQMLL